MRKHISNPHCQSPLRRVAASAVLASAGWLAIASGAIAQEVATSAAESAPAVVSAAIDRSLADTGAWAASNETDTKIGATAPSADENATPVAAVESVTVADQAADKKPFVTDSTVTRYDFASLDGHVIDDHMLEHQHGRAVGMIMVAATPNTFRGNSVTLWDEIGPPVQTPQPSDAARAAQTGNVVTYNRK